MRAYIDFYLTARGRDWPTVIRQRRKDARLDSSWSGVPGKRRPFSDDTTPTAGLSGDYHNLTRSDSIERIGTHMLNFPFSNLTRQSHHTRHRSARFRGQGLER
ncbi:hypothetical protein POX_a01518 [Penicillium oxalicum]|uniref:hypothetical protein n=1 Tax=Penicillium oxalicum TaxID=69781 RepID=UPI0020B82FC3|nr:hypothetical protein POX_a01518 [Penicillium oxalicum]KAI2794917.1 hypothetical protein POX_a01518 [Penicillium oxalicum]